MRTRSRLLLLGVLGAGWPGEGRLGPVSQVREGVLALRNRPLLDDVVVDSKVIPPADSRALLAETGVLGLRASDERSQELLAAVNAWYKQHGFLSSWAAALSYDGDRVRIQCAEPQLDDRPVDLRFYKRVPGVASGPDQGPEDVAVQIAGRTRPGFVAKALGIEPGKPLKRFDVSGLVNYGPFSNVQASWFLSDRDRVRLLLTAEEKPSRSFAPSFTLSRGAIAGDLSFEDRNFLGRGLHLSTSIKQGRHDPIACGDVRLANPNLGRPGAKSARVYSTLDPLRPGARTLTPNDFVLAGRAMTRIVGRDAGLPGADDGMREPGLSQRVGVEFRFDNPFRSLMTQQRRHSTRTIFESARNLDTSFGPDGEKLAEVGATVVHLSDPRQRHFLRTLGKGFGLTVGERQRRWKYSADVGMRPLGGGGKLYTWGEISATDLVVLDSKRAMPRWLATFRQKVMGHTGNVPVYAQVPLGGRKTLRGHAEGSLGIPGLAVLSRVELSRLWTELPDRIFPAGQKPRVGLFVDGALFPRQPMPSPPSLPSPPEGEEDEPERRPAPRLGVRERVGAAGGMGLGLEWWILKGSVATDLRGNILWDAGLSSDFEW